MLPFWMKLCVFLLTWTALRCVLSSSWLLELLLFGFAIYLMGTICRVLAEKLPDSFKFTTLVSDMDKKIVIVTGCDSGFGHTTAIELDKMGFVVFAGCLFPETGGALTLTEKCSDNLQVINMDITRDDHVDKAYDQIAQYIQTHEDTKLWAVVNNAGILGCISETEWTPLSAYKKVMDVNLLGTVRVSSKFIPLLRASMGRIVTVASVAGRYAVPGQSAYSCSKYALVSYTDALRRDMRKWNISVHTVEPSLYKTPLTTKTAIHKLVDSVWSNTSASVKESYGEEYHKDWEDTLDRSLDKLAQPEERIRDVIDCLVDAVANEDAKTQYIPNLMVNLRLRIISSLPYYLQDELLVRGAAPKTPPADVVNEKVPKPPFKKTASLVMQANKFRKELLQRTISSPSTLLSRSRHSSGL